MPNGLMQLVAYGAQDLYLTGNPQITFFKMMYKRHTNFSIEPIEQTVNGNQIFGSNLTCNLMKNGDLITKIYIKCNVKLTGSNGKFAWINNLGHYLFDNIELLVGGTTIDKQYSDWLEIWYQLARNTSHDRGYNKMIGNIDNMTSLSDDDKSATLYIPLKFYFNKFDGLAIPIIALQYHDIRIDFSIRNLDQLVVKERTTIINGDINNISLICNYIFLDSEERKRFAEKPHEYLIEQTQFSGVEKVESQIEKYILNFNHPSKCLYWFVKNGNFINNKYFLSYVPQNNLNNELINIASIRYVLSQLYSNSGIIFLNLNGLGVTNVIDYSELTYYNYNEIKFNDVIIKVKYENITNIDNVLGTGNIEALINNFEVVKPLNIELVSTPINIIFNDIRRTDDVNNIGHPNYDIKVIQLNNYGYYLNYKKNIVKNALLKLNGHERFSVQGSNFFNFLQPYETHISSPNDGLNLFSFSLNPTEYQPSGTCNFSRIDNSTLELEFINNVSSINGNELHIMTFNYNIFRIMKGLGGIAYTS